MLLDSSVPFNLVILLKLFTFGYSLSFELGGNFFPPAFHERVSRTQVESSGFSHFILTTVFLLLRNAGAYSAGQV